MNRWNPTSRRVAIRRLKNLGFDGPVQGTRHQYQGTRHQYMVYGERRLILFSNRDYSVHQVRILLRQASERIGRVITLEEWNSLD